MKIQAYMIGSAALLLLMSVGCSRTATEKPPAKQTLQGQWFGYEDGATNKIILSFIGSRFAYSDARSNDLGSGTFVANESVQPMQMDLTFEKIPAPKYVGKVGLAIYEFQGDALKIAGSEPGSSQRPTNIAGGAGVRTFTFKRE